MPRLRRLGRQKKIRRLLMLLLVSVYAAFTFYGSELQQYLMPPTSGTPYILRLQYDDSTASEDDKSNDSPRAKQQQQQQQHESDNKPQDPPPSPPPLIQKEDTNNASQKEWEVASSTTATKQTTVTTQTVTNVTSTPSLDWEGGTTIAPRAGDIFVPGTLDLTRLEAFKRCYINGDLYRPHYTMREYRTVSEQAGIVYVHVEKSGSTESRTAMKDLFHDAKLVECPSLRQRNNEEKHARYATFHWFTFSRDPLSRYVTGFQTAMDRWRMYRRGSAPGTQKLQRFVDKHNSTKEKDVDGIMAALESFVMDHHNGSTIPNSHLQLQSTAMLKAACPLRLDAIHDLTTLNTVFGGFSEDRNRTLAIHQKKHYSDSHKRNISKISLPAKRKICQLSALDYCCLNYELPPECEGALSCRWINPRKGLLHEDHPAPTLRTSHNPRVLLIEAVSPYPVLPAVHAEEKK